MKLNPEPWQEKLPLAPLRAGWIIFCLLLLPGILFLCKIPEIQVPFFSVLAALPACIGTCRQLGIKPLEFSDFALVTGGYVAIILLSMLAAAPWKLFWDSMGVKYAESQDMLQMISTAARQDQIRLYISVCIITPVVEEVLFRRIIYSSWHHIHPPTAFLGTSLIFSLAHFFLMGIPGLLIMGLAFQLAYLIRENLLTAMLLHSVVNTMAFFVNIFGETNIR